MKDQLGQEKRDKLHRMLDMCTYDDEKKRTLYYIINELVTESQYDYVFKKLSMNEIQDKDRIKFGLNYSQSDIKKTLNKKYGDNL